MRRSATLFSLVLLAACDTAVPDDRVVEVISQTPVESSAPTPPGGSERATAAAPEVETQPIVDTTAQCDEDTYAPLVGQQAGGKQFPVGPRLRVFGVNDIITQELVPQRTNIVVDDTGTIVRVYCG